MRMIGETGVNGVAIARGCIGNPWIFRDCNALWSGGALPPPPSIEEQRWAIDSHWKDALEFHGERLAPRIMRKFGIKYSEHHPLARQVRDAFITVKTPADFIRVLETWYDAHTDWPTVVRRRGHGDLIAAGAAT